MAVLDIVFLIMYFMVLGGIGYWSSKRSLDSTKSYFLAGGNIGWIAIGASLFASNISAEHFIGLAGSGAAGGMAVGQFELLACFCLLILGWVFVPLYLRTGVFTMPEFLENRFNPQCRTYLSAISLIAYVFTKISVSVYAGALVLDVVLGWNIWTGAVILIVATGIYTVFGGLRAVVYTHLFQAIILIGGGIVLTAIAISKVGGFGALTQGAAPGFLNLWKGMNHPDFPWTGILFGAPILGIWYWCTDQMIVQRTLAARNLSEAHRGTLFAGALKLLPIFILVLPGIAGGMLFKDVVPNKIYATMVNELLPIGVKGLMVAALLSALMSSLASVFNSSSTLITMDFYKKYRPNASEKQLVRFGQLATVVLVFVGLLWIPFIGVISNQLFIYLQSVQAYIAPPIAVVFLLGVSWRRLNGKGALASLLGGFALGALRFVVETGVKSGWITWQPFVKLASINFLHFAILLAAICSVIMVVVSLFTAPPTEDKLGIFAKRATERIAESHKAHGINVMLSVLLVVAVLAIWAYFSPLVFPK